MTPSTLIVRIPLIFISAGLLAGCQSNCSFLSRSSSIGCDMGLVGGLLLYPVVAPIVAATDAIENHSRKVQAKKDKQEDQATYQALKEGIEKNDVLSLQKCVNQCQSLFTVEKDERNALRISAAKKLILMDSPAIEKNQIPTMMTAYWLFAWDDDSVNKNLLNSHNVMRGWELAAQIPDSYFVQGMQLAETRLDVVAQARVLQQLAPAVYVIKLLGLPEADVQKALDNCVADNLLPDHPQLIMRKSICGLAYQQFYRIRNPEETKIDIPKNLEERWSADTPERKW